MVAAVALAPPFALPALLTLFTENSAETLRFSGLSLDSRHFPMFYKGKLYIFLSNFLDRTETNAESFLLLFQEIRTKATSASLPDKLNLFIAYSFEKTPE